MIKTRIRHIRRQKGYTLQDLAERIRPTPTTAQTIGRLETGSRKMTLDWLEKIAAALDCSPVDIIDFGGDPEIPLAGTLAAGGAIVAAGVEALRFSVPGTSPMAIKIAEKAGDLEVGDTLVCEKSGAEGFTDCIGRDCLVTTTAGEKLYGRLIQGSDTGTYTLIPAIGNGNIRYNLPLRSAARRTMLIRYY